MVFKVLYALLLVFWDKTIERLIFKVVITMGIAGCLHLVLDVKAIMVN